MVNTYRKRAERPGWQPALSFVSVLEDSVKLAKERHPYAVAYQAHVDEKASGINTNIKNKIINKKNQTINIGTWNIRGMNQIGKAQIIIEAINEQNLKIFGVSETFWGKNSDFAMTSTNGNQYTMHLRGNTKRKGVGLIIERSIDERITRIDSIDETIMGCIINGKPRDTMVIQIDAPISDCTEEESLNFYEKIEEKITRLGGRRERLVVVMDDFYSSIGEGKEGDIIGQYGLGERNKKGQLLVEYCREKIQYKEHLRCTSKEKKTYMGESRW